MNCPIHDDVQMKQMWKKSDPDHQGESWYSHKDGNNWCNGKPPKPSSNGIQGQALAVILNKLIKIEDRLDKMADFLKRSNLVVAEPVIPSNKPIPF